MSLTTIFRTAWPARKLPLGTLRSRVFDSERRDLPCRGVDPEQWFPETKSIKPAYADALCQGCPVRAECLEFALRSPQDGVWGGTTPEERNAAIAARRQIAEQRALRRTQRDQSSVDETVPAVGQVA